MFVLCETIAVTVFERIDVPPMVKEFGAVVPIYDTTISTFTLAAWFRAALDEVPVPVVPADALNTGFAIMFLCS